MLKVLLLEAPGSVRADDLRPRFEVYPVADVARLAETAQRLRPQVVVVDSSPPSLRAVRRLMSEFPLPVVMLSTDPAMFSRTATAAGAVSAAAIPGSARELDELCLHLELMSEVAVFRRTPPATTPRHRVYRAVGLVASTGGPTAVAELLAGLGPTRAVVLVVQHMAPDSLPGFVQWLGDRVPQAVQLARHAELTEGGRVYVAPPHAHLEWDGCQTLLSKAEPEHYQRPSGNVLLRSLARYAGSSSLGVLLTGLGEDGAEGLLALRSAGGFTLVESEATAVAFEMPAAALRLKAAKETWPLPNLAPRLRELLHRVSEYPSA